MPVGAVLQDLLDVVGQLDVRVQLDAHAVDGFGGLGAQALQLLPLEVEFALLQPVFGEHRAVGVDDDHAALAVDDQHLAVADQLPRVVRRHHRRHVEAARDDRGMRRHAAQVGEKRAVAVLLELDHVRGREVVGDQDRLLLRHRRGQRARLAEQTLQHALADLDDVRLALAQVRILDLLELLDQHAHLLRERPLRVTALFQNDLPRDLGERRVVQDHPVDVQEGTELARNVAAGHCRMQALQFLLDLLDREIEARDLGVELRGRDLVVRDLEGRMRNELRASDRNAGRDAHAVQREADHHSAPTIDPDGAGRSATIARRTRRGRVRRSRASPPLRPDLRSPAAPWSRRMPSAA